MTMHKKMYKDSPKLERDGESGKMKITKAEKKSAEVSAGTEGVVKDEHEDAVMKLHQKHSKERMDMHHKHEKEHLSLSHKGLGKEASQEAPQEEKKAGETAGEGE